METKPKILICNGDVAMSAKKIVESINQENEKNCHLFSIDKIKEVKHFDENVDSVNENLDFEPVKVDNVRCDTCLIFWNYDENGLPIKIYHVTHADAFIDGMNLCQNLGKSTIAEENSFFKKTGILFPLIALERKMTYILQQSKEESMTTYHSPLPKIKEYSYKRPKITVTMQELENQEDDEDDFLPDYNAGNIENPHRIQPIRNCQIKDKVELGQGYDSDSTDEETLQEFIENAVESAVSVDEYNCSKCPFHCSTNEELKNHEKLYHSERQIIEEPEYVLPFYQQPRKFRRQ